ncbi:hypothetical protein DFH08DRAFT_456668 [Mycena albidolilacea]|uniref:Uncharacterized protein n=1 Tax=Mycena albidolilacea TaxID=1033008 RepID=A0AAD6Z7P8_9AGAR|nr:hypothetical protein DFH08DRAFT_456668 [Mycena albidolilacea]
MEPFRACLYVQVFLLCSFTTVWYSRLDSPGAAPSDPTLRWIILELKPTFAVAWLFVAVFLLCKLTYLNSPPRYGAIAPVEVSRLSLYTRAGSFIVLCGLLCNAGLASFALFKHGVTWVQQGDTLENVMSFIAFFLHGLVNCVGVSVVLCALHYGVRYILKICRGPEILDADADVVNLEKGVEEI